jgi:hypothetical protein
MRPDRYEPKGLSGYAAIRHTGRTRGGDKRIHRNHACLPGSMTGMPYHYARVGELATHRPGRVAFVPCLMQSRISRAVIAHVYF